MWYYRMSYSRFANIHNNGRTSKHVHIRWVVGSNNRLTESRGAHSHMVPFTRVPSAAWCHYTAASRRKQVHSERVVPEPLFIDSWSAFAVLAGKTNPSQISLSTHWWFRRETKPHTHTRRSWTHPSETQHFDLVFSPGSSSMGYLDKPI